MSRIPAYEKVYQQLKKKIVEGEYAVGELLPPEPEIEKQYEVSRTTVRRAMEILSREKFVAIRQGRGTQVLEYKTQQDLNYVTSISETLKKRGYDVKSRSMHIDQTEASSTQAEDLEIELGTEITRVQRVQEADGKPIAIMRNYLLPHMVPNMEQYTNQFTSLYGFIEDKYDINIDSAKNSISAKVADFTEAELLGIRTGSPILYIRRVCYENGNPVCIDRISLVGDIYEFEVYMEGRFKEEI